MNENGMITLTREECLARLGANHIGRIAFVDRVGVLPMIMPVNYVFAHEHVIFRTDAGSKLDAAVRNAPVAFEIDGTTPAQRTGWSVVVRGRVTELGDREVGDLINEPPIVWAPGERSHYIWIAPQLISGRQISVAESAHSWWG